MYLPPYTPDELKLVSKYRVYLRWQTYRLRAASYVTQLSRRELLDIGARYGIRVLRSEWDQTDFIVLASIHPADSISATASKLKGQLSKRLRTVSESHKPAFSKGYFARTVGENTERDVQRYVARQEEHHGYDRRVRSPVFTETYDDDVRHLQPAHAFAVTEYHVVLRTWRRRGVFTTREAHGVAEHWRTRQKEHDFSLRRASFLPDHVHLAIELHPKVSPQSIVLTLMNAAQDVMKCDFAESLIQAGVERLWQPSGYVGSFGTLHEGAIRKYVTHWKASRSPT